MANIDRTRQQYLRPSHQDNNTTDINARELQINAPLNLRGEPTHNKFMSHVNSVMTLIKQLAKPSQWSQNTPLNTIHNQPIPNQNQNGYPVFSPSIHGTRGNDFLIGSHYNDQIRGYNGNDILLGLNGNDTLRGHRGNDYLHGGQGHDSLHGGRGNDLLQGGQGHDSLHGGRGHDLLQGGRGQDYLRGGYGNDILRGGYDNDVLSDNLGNNKINGGQGQDLLRLNSRIDDYYINFANNVFELSHKHNGYVNSVKNVELFDFNGQFYTQTQLRDRIDLLAQNQYHSFDGSNNNLDRPNLGKANTVFREILPKDFSRQPGTATEANLPGPREVSNAVSAQTEQTQNKKGLSDMFWLWGQFLDHDINLTPTNDEASAPIGIPAGDPFFDPTGTGTQQMPFNRSVTTTVDGEPKQINAITAFIDGSNIYGSDKATADSLRLFQGGRLETSANNLLPTDESNQFVSGDVRANENIGLSSMHTLWMREHNRIADQLATQNPGWTDEQLYQESRKMVIAEMQAITYNEFLPGLLGGENLSPYQGYNPSVSPQITDSFSTAAYRLGHTMLSSNLLRLDEQGNEIPQGNLALRDAFFQPNRVSEAGIDPILRGFAAQTAQAVDPMLVDDVRNFLFGPPGSGGFDLASLNIQRGRDHAVPGYNDARAALGLHRITSFDDPIFQGDFGQKLASVYQSPDDVDLWVGGLAENSQGNSLVGQTFTSILKEQFESLRDGDRFWYENRFSPQQVNELNQLRLSDIIRRNTDIQNIQDNAMVASNVHLQNQNAEPRMMQAAPIMGGNGFQNGAQNNALFFNNPAINRLIDPLPVPNAVADFLAIEAQRAGSQQ